MNENQLISKIENGQIKGMIFDLDGTLIDSASIWDQVDQEFLGERGFDVPDDYVEAISPLGARNAAIYTVDRFGLDEDIDDIVEIWIDMAKDKYAVEVLCKPYAKEFVKKMSEAGIKLSIATSSDRQLFMSTLERENLLPFFEHIITVDQVDRGKGYPDIYLKAAEKMELHPEQCVVFEDILAGVRGAKLGNFNVVAVADVKSLDKKEILSKESDLYINGFEELL